MIVEQKPKISVESKSSKSSSGSSFLNYCYNLNIALIVLKFCGVIECSWFLVMSPIWIPLALIIFAGIIGMIVGGKD